MNWKGFSKFNRKKLILTLALLALSLFFFLGYAVTPYPMSCGELASCRLTLNFFQTGSLLLSLPLIISIYFGGIELTIIVFILSIFYWYLLSCLIIWAYDKFRKK